jgi:hypothetical protein
LNNLNDSTSLVIFREDWAARNNPDTPASKSVGDLEWVEHCRVREFAERAAAKHAGSDAARRVHQELAQAYARMIRRAGA